MPRLGVIFVEYDKARYRGAFRAIMRIVGRLRRWNVVIARVDNANEGGQVRFCGKNIIETGGDNVVHEFSGWMKGVSVSRDKFGACDCYLLVTDAFRAYGDHYRSLLDDDVLSFLVAEKAVGGLVDMPTGKPPDMEIMGRRFEFWVRTSFFIVPAGVLDKIGTLVSIDNVGEFCDSDYIGRAFRDNAPLSFSYKAYIEGWLTSRWHSAFRLSPATWERFRDKVRSILNEHLLTLKLCELDIPVYDLRFLRRLCIVENYRLTNQPDDAACCYRRDIPAQTRYPSANIFRRLLFTIRKLL